MHKYNNYVWRSVFKISFKVSQLNGKVILYNHNLLGKYDDYIMLIYYINIPINIIIYKNNKLILNYSSMDEMGWSGNLQDNIDFIRNESI